MGFEPFHDYEQLDEEQAAEIREALAEYRKASDDLLEAEAADQQVVYAKRLLKTHQNTSKVIAGVNREIYTIPAMVHTAGEVEYEEHEVLDMMIHIQRCERCGSVLHASPRESGGFFTPGDKIGKKSTKKLPKRSSYPRGMMPTFDQMYYVGERDLEKHELECVSLKSIFEEI